jgi:hypothetical protein
MEWKRECWRKGRNVGIMELWNMEGWKNGRLDGVWEEGRNVGIMEKGNWGRLVEWKVGWEKDGFKFRKCIFHITTSFGKFNLN